MHTEGAAEYWHLAHTDTHKTLGTLEMKKKHWERQRRRRDLQDAIFKQAACGIWTSGREENKNQGAKASMFSPLLLFHVEFRVFGREAS